MAYLRKPESDKDRLQTIIKSIASAASDLAKGKKYLSETTVTAITTFKPLFNDAYSDVKVKKEKRMQETEEQTKAFWLLDVTSNDMMHGIKRRVKREGLPKSILSFYEIDKHGDIPRPTNKSDLLDLADSLIQGDTASVAAGNETMVNPTVADLHTALTDARREYDETDSADRDLDIAQAALAALRNTADGYLIDIIEELRFALRKMDNPSQRRIIRTYGFKYEYTPGEPQPPSKPDDFTYLWHDPNLVLTCDPVLTAYSYEFVYSEDNVIWHALFTGEKLAYTYAPPVGTRYYKVRAENDLGYGEWSEIIEFTKPEIPQ